MSHLMWRPEPNLSERADFRLSYPTAPASSPTPANNHSDLRETPPPSSPLPLPYRNYRCRIFAPWGVNLAWRVEELIVELETLFKLRAKAVEDIRVYNETCTITDTPIVADDLRIFEDVKQNIEEKLWKAQEELRYTKGQHYWVGENRERLMQHVGKKRKHEDYSPDEVEEEGEWTGEEEKERAEEKEKAEEKENAEEKEKGEEKEKEDGGAEKKVKVV